MDRSTAQTTLHQRKNRGKSPPKASYKADDESRAARETGPRQDVGVLLAGLTFIAALIGAMYALGMWRGWDAMSGLYHNVSATSRHRFMEEPFVPDPTIRGRSGIDAESRWYYWKLKPWEVTLFSHLFVWMCYCGHQFTIWGVLFLAQRQKAKSSAKDRYSTNLGKYGWISFGLNIFFHLLHLFQTHLTYDGLAQDVSIASSQSSVIMLLIYVIVLEYGERGVFFGWPNKSSTGDWSKKMTLNYDPVYLVRKYHGYAFAWASVYTFWYHPMENTYGHALGFIHTWILLLQGSLMYTPIHKNRYWRFVLEAWVSVHGAAVAFQTSDLDPSRTLWPMFTFGFALILVLTWLFILPFWWRVPAWMRVLPLLIYTAVTVVSYRYIPDQQGRPFTRMHEVLRMPAFFYPYFFFSWLVVYTALRLDAKFTIRPSTPLKRGILVALTFLSFSFLVVISRLSEAFNVSMPLMLLTVIFVTIHCFVAGYTMVFMKNAIVTN